MNQMEDYRPPGDREELLRRYACGERSFQDTELSDTDLSGITLDGASFERLSWFFNSNFAAQAFAHVMLSVRTFVEPFLLAHPSNWLRSSRRMWKEQF